MPATCINLLERFGGRYRVTFDPAYDSRNVPRAKLDPWMMQIPCRGGIVIYPHGGTTLAVEIDYHRHIAARVGAIEGVRLSQCGDGEKTFLFDVALFEQVAEVVQPKKRRRLSEGHRAKLVEAASRHWPSKGHSVGSKGQSGERPATPALLGGPTLASGALPHDYTPSGARQ